MRTRGWNALILSSFAHPGANAPHGSCHAACPGWPQACAVPQTPLSCRRGSSSSHSLPEQPLSCKKIITQTKALPSTDSVCTTYRGKIQCWMEHGHGCLASEATSRFTCYLHPSSFLLKQLLYQAICSRPSLLSSRKPPCLQCRALSITLGEPHSKCCFIQNVARQ